MVASTKFGPDLVGTKALLTHKLAEEGRLEFPKQALQEAFRASLQENPRYVLEAEEVDFTPFWKLPLRADHEP